MKRTVFEEAGRAYARGCLAGVGLGLLIGGIVGAAGGGALWPVVVLAAVGSGLSALAGFVLLPSWLEDDE